MICVACHKRGGSAKDKCPFCGTPYEEASNEQFSPEFIVSLDKGALFDFHIKNIDLDFDMDAVHRMNVALGLETDDSIDKNKYESDIDTETPRRSPLVEDIGLYHEPVTIDSEDKTIDSEPSESQPEASNSATQNVEEENTQSEIDDVNFKSNTGNIKWGELTLHILKWSLFFIVLFFIVKYIFFYIGTWQPFKESLDSGNYTEAVAIYNDCDSSYFRKKADKAVSSEMSSILSSYQSNKITGKDAKAQLDTLASVCGSDNQEVIDIYNDATEIEQSKRAYQEGMQHYELGEYAEAAECWAKVSPKDTSNYESLQKLLSDKKVVSKMEEDIKSDSDKSQNQILQGLLYLQSIIGDKNALKKSIESIQAEATDEVKDFYGNGVADGPLANEEIEDPIDFSADIVVNQDCPILISEVKPSRPSGDGSINLIIKWVNRSGRDIDRVVFYVQPTSEYGYLLSCRKGNYSLYYAIDEGPYPNGTGTPSDTWMWRNAWYNSLIQKVELLQVVIDYTDGEREVISGEKSLEALYK